MRGWATPDFWSGVEDQLRTLDTGDLLRFTEADRLPFEMRPGFESELWKLLQSQLEVY